MTHDSVSATMVINAPAEAIFAVLSDPAQHAAIDGTGWVSAPLDSQPLTATGQIFRMSMYHPNHPDGHYQTANRVQVFDPPRTIAWEPGYDADDGTLRSDVQADDVVSSLIGIFLVSGSPEQTGRMLDLLVAGVATT